MTSSGVQRRLLANGRSCKRGIDVRTTLLVVAVLLASAMLPSSASAAVCALMLGYFSLLKRKRCTVEGRLQPRGREARGAGAGGDGAAEALPLAHGHGRLSQYRPSPSESRVSAAA